MNGRIIALSDTVYKQTDEDHFELIKCRSYMLGEDKIRNIEDINQALRYLKYVTVLDEEGNIIARNWLFRED